MGGNSTSNANGHHRRRSNAPGSECVTANLQGDNTRSWLASASASASEGGASGDSDIAPRSSSETGLRFPFRLVNPSKESPNSRRKSRKLITNAFAQPLLRLLALTCHHLSTVATAVQGHKAPAFIRVLLGVLSNTKVATALSLFAAVAVCFRCWYSSREVLVPVKPVNCAESMESCSQYTSDGFPDCAELMSALSLQCISGPPIDMQTSMSLLLERLRNTEVVKPAYFEHQLQEMPLVTIIVPMYNTEALVVPSLKSLLAQTYENIEIFLVDDGSTDATVEVASRIAASDSRVTVLTVPTGGGSGPYWAKNYAIMRSSGKYITYQDSDDISHPMRIEFQVRFLMANPSVVYCTPMYVRLTPNFELVGNRGLLQRLSFQSSMFPRRVINELGYMDSVRVSGDDEFFARLRVVYGQKARRRIDIREKETGMRIPMYFAYRRAGSLTLNSESGYDISRAISGDRLAYINRYTQWYEKETAVVSAAGGRGRNSAHTGRSFLYVDFPLRFRPFSVPHVHRIATPFDNQMVVASMETCRQRVELLKVSVPSIAPYVDDLYIYLNDASANTVLALVENFPNVHLIPSDGRHIADRGRFYPIASGKFSNSYIFALSDQIVYPRDYVRKMIIKVESYDRQHILGVHCIQLNYDQASYYEGRDVRPFMFDLHADKSVHILGTGTAVWHTDTLPHLDMDIFSEAGGMSDIHFAVHAKRHNITMTCVERDTVWLKLVESTGDVCKTGPVEEDLESLLQNKDMNQMRTAALKEVFPEMFIM